MTSLWSIFQIYNEEVYDLLARSHHHLTERLELGQKTKDSKDGFIIEGTKPRKNTNPSDVYRKIGP